MDPKPLETAAETAQADRALAALRHSADVGCGAKTLEDAVPAQATAADFRAVSVEAFRLETDRLLLGKHPDDGLESLRVVGALDPWLPEVAAMVGFGDGEWRHKDVWKHTKQVVMQSVPRIAVRWGALLHDIGKPKTRSIEPSGEVHFFGHSEVGASMFKKRVGKRLGMDDAMFERVHYLILHHLRASQYDGSWTDSAVRRFARELEDGLIDLLDLSRADITTKRPERKKRGLRQISELAGRIRTLAEADAKVPPLPKGLGTVLMAKLGIPPSRQLGDLMHALEACVEAGELAPGKDADLYVAFVEAHRARFGLV